MATNTVDRVYDSDAVRTPVVTELGNLWRYRGLIRVLARRDLIVRYKRSILGLWWTLLNPILTALVMWAVFAQLLERAARLGVPYILHVLSGVLFMAVFSQGINSGGSSLVGNRGVLVKVPVPAEVFSFASTISVGINLVFSVVPLLVISMLTGWGIPATAPLAIIPALLMLCLVTGLGLIVGSLAVHFYDILDFTKVLLQLLTYMVPVIYPIEIVPDRFQPLILGNPIYSFLQVFRGMILGTDPYPVVWWNWVVMFVSAFGFLALGVWVFSRSRRTLVALL
jgi:ABC-type polysaccharide/polyol phosphate export permease